MAGHLDKERIRIPVRPYITDASPESGASYTEE